MKLSDLIQIRRNVVLFSFVAIFVFVVVSTILLIVNVRDSQFKNKIINDFIFIQKIDDTREDECHKDFINKCLLARQVYQFSWYNQTKTKIGNLNLEKVYGMDIFQYNDLIELSWKLNKELSIPIDSWENYIMLAKWIVESGICNEIEHKTGEIIKMAGYRYDGFIDALSRYKYEMHIDKGNPMYIASLYNENLDIQKINEIFKNHIIVAKFDYAYIKYLRSRYEYNWDWVLTGFHYGSDKTDYWWYILGMRTIPNFRVDGKWSDEFLRKYYQSIYEIAQGIARGYLGRVSKYEEIVGISKNYESWSHKYVNTLKMKVKSQQAFEHLEKKYNELQESFTNYKKINKELLIKMAELNDLNLQKGTMKEKIQTLKYSIQYKWNQLTKRK